MNLLIGALAWVTQVVPLSMTIAVIIVIEKRWGQALGECGRGRCRWGSGGRRQHRRRV